MLAACGSKPPPHEPIANRPSAPQAPSCADAGAILRGPIGSDDPKAGPTREGAIAAACREDKWSAEILSCVVASRAPVKCVDKLTHSQRDHYQARLDKWGAVYGGDMYGGDMYGGDAYGGGLADRYVDCSDVVDDPERYPPSLDDKAPERDWVIAQRRRTIEHTCNTEGWSEATKECLADATDAGIGACLKDEPSQGLLAKQLGDLDGLAAKIAAAKKKPAAIACAKVVDAHYGDARWKDKLVGAKDRKKQIADSRKAMQKACNDEHWSDTTRACVIADGGDRCFDSASPWGYPALAAGGLPADCTAYKAEIDKLMTCDKMPVAARDAMKQAYDQASAGWSNLPADALPALATACRAGADAVMQSARSVCGP